MDELSLGVLYLSEMVCWCRKTNRHKELYTFGHLTVFTMRQAGILRMFHNFCLYIS